MEKSVEATAPQTYGQYFSETLKSLGDTVRSILCHEGDYRWYEEIHTLAHVALLNFRKDLAMPISKFYDSRISFQDWGAVSTADRTFGIYSHHDLSYFSVVLYSTITKYDFRSDREIDKLMKEIFVRAISPFSDQMQLYLKAKSKDTTITVEMQNSYKKACVFLEECGELMAHKVLRECPDEDKENRFANFLLKKSGRGIELTKESSLGETEEEVLEFLENLINTTADKEALRNRFEESLAKFVDEKKQIELKNDFFDSVKFTPSKEVINELFLNHAKTIVSELKAAEQADQKGDDETRNECILSIRNKLRNFHRIVYKQLSRKRSH